MSKQKTAFNTTILLEQTQIIKPKCAAGVYDCKLCYYNKTCSHDIYLCRDAFLYTSAGESLCCENFSMNNRHCTHGGGLVCSKWRNHSRRMLDKGRKQQ